MSNAVDGGAAGLRRIWLCADDYGLSPAVNRGIRDLVARGRINATSCMVVAPSMLRSEAVSLEVLNAVAPRVSIGLHLTLTAPFRPLSAGFRPLREAAFPSFTTLIRDAVLRRLDPAALLQEVRSQLRAFHELFGRMPDFVDGHRHVQLLPQVRDAVLLAVKEAAPGAWVRQCGRVLPLAARLADKKGLLLDLFSSGFRARAATLGIATNPAFAGTYDFDPAVDFAALFPRFLQGLPDGGLVMCHPGFVDGELQRLDPLTTLREKEHGYLISDAFTADLAARGLALAKPS
ncbi:MAG: ChbG/HpnK family deacetylase [Xanthobacteraceae bacterium]